MRERAGPTSTRRVLIVSYFFPPDGGPGTQRTAKFCKHLIEFGWSPIVITRTPRKSRGRWEPEDATLLGDVGENTRVLRVADPDDPSTPWLDAARDAALAAVEAHRPDVALITMSPFELTRVGDAILERTDIPVVYDLRDPWALDGWRLYATRRQWVADLRRMREALASASGVVANTPESKRAFLAEVPGLADERVTVINNGFDPEDFDLSMGPLESDRLWIVHTGTLHSRTLYEYQGLKGRLKRLRHFRPEPIDTSGRTPLHLLRALRWLRETSHPLADRFRVALVGLKDPETERCVRESGVAEMVRIEGYLSHRESVAWLRRAHALFLPLHGFPPGEDTRRSLIVPGKVYEYLAARRPILACLPPGDAREIVEESGNAFIADPVDARSIADALVALAEDVERRGIERELPPTLLRYERGRLTEKLAQFLTRIAERPARVS
ncbi:MAG: glycosyltransferase [Planctomycetes bacterium]|nr:glycosyltransferase [Planctomycetota bacterium]